MRSLNGVDAGERGAARRGARARGVGVDEIIIGRTSTEDASPEHTERALRLCLTARYESVAWLVWSRFVLLRDHRVFVEHSSIAIRIAFEFVALRRADAF